MAMKLGSLYVSLSASVGPFMKSIDAALKAAERFASQTKKVAAEAAQASAVVAGLGAAALRLASSVDGPTKKAMDGLQRSSQLLAVQVADMLLPAVRSLSQMLRNAASVVAGLDPATKQQAASFAVMAVQVAVVAKALSVFAGVAGNVLGVVRGALGAITAVGLGPLLGIASGLAIVAAGIAALHYAWRSNIGGIADAWKRFADWFGLSSSELFKAAGDWVNNWVADFVGGLREMTYGLGLLMNKLGKTDSAAKWFGLSLALEDSRKKILEGGFWDSVVTQALDLGKAAGEAFVDEWKRIADEMGISKLFDPKKGKAIGLGRGGPYTSGAIAPINAMGLNRTVDTSEYRAAAELDARAVKDFMRGLQASREAELRARGELTAQLFAEEHRFTKLMSVLPQTFGGMSIARMEGPKAEEMRGRLGQATAEDARQQAWSDAVGADSWEKSQRVLSEGLRSSLTAGETLLLWGKRMSSVIGNAGQQLLGAVGDLVASVVQGAQQGGVWGAIIAAFMEIAKKTESAMKFLDVAMEFVKQLATMVEPLVRPIFDALTNVLGIVVQIIAPVFEALKPLFEGIGEFIKKLAPILWAVGDLLQALSPIIELIGQFVAGFLDLISPVLDIIGGVIKVIATVVLGIMIGLNELAALFGDEKAKAESARLQGVVDAMWNRDARLAEAEGNAAGAALRNAAAQDEAARAATKASESLTNVPSGYRVALARYEADLGIGGAAAAAAAGAGGTTINGDVYVTSDGETIDQVAEDARREAARERGQQRGNPTGGNRSGNGGRNG